MSIEDPSPGSLIQRSLAGELDGEAFSRTLREILFCLCFHHPRGILLDCREAALSFCSMGDILDIARKIAPFRPNHPVRIAHLANPADPEQLRIMRLLETVLEMEGFTYRFFLDPTEARNWLGE
ncbi:MAG: hypothetical protein WHT06_14865 [Desulfobacterales bacterium]